MYYRIRFTPANNKPRTVWAKGYNVRQDGTITFTICDKEGTINENGTIYLVYCTQEDIIFCKPAKMNLHYAELEVTK